MSEQKPEKKPEKKPVTKTASPLEEYYTTGLGYGPLAVNGDLRGQTGWESYFSSHILDDQEKKKNAQT